MDQPPAAAPAPPGGPAGRGFLDRLRAEPALHEFATEFAYTPPVPGAATGVTVVYAFMRRGLPPAMPDVCPPEYRLQARWPEAAVTAVEPVTAASLGLALVDGETLGPNTLPPPYDGPATRAQLLAEKAEFEAAQTALLPAFWGDPWPSARVCARYRELLPVYATPRLVPLLRRTSPAFFARVDHAAALRRGEPGAAWR